MKHASDITYAEIDAGNCYQSFMMGWRHGATARAYDDRARNHPRADIQQAYRSGYDQGRATSQKASRFASDTYGFTPSILRAADDQ